MKNILLILFSLAILISCGSNLKYKNPDLYVGFIVKDKNSYVGDKLYLSVNKDSLFLDLRVYQFDYDRFEIGDTIK